MIKMTCQFWITAMMIAWLWRRRGYNTMIGRVKHLHADGSVEKGWHMIGTMVEVGE